MSPPLVTSPASAGPGLRALPDGSFARTEVVTPAMCGHNSLFAGRVGDWTWDAVSAACDVDAYRAHDETGVPTYLSFHYVRIRGDAHDDAIAMCREIGNRGCVLYAQLASEFSRSIACSIPNVSE